MSDLNSINSNFEHIGAGERLSFLQQHFGAGVVASTSFGLQAAVMLHLIKQYTPDLPVVFIDTGYHFEETYLYAKTLSDLLELDVRWYSPQQTAARQEALYGRLWDGDEQQRQQYAVINKIEPMNRAIQDLQATVWLSGLRRKQSSTRSERNFVEQQRAVIKAYPILDWSDEQVEAYLDQHGLPRHPLQARGYVTMGDWHSTRPVRPGMTAEQTRFGGAKYECGLHLDSGVADYQI